MAISHVSILVVVEKIAAYCVRDISGKKKPYADNFSQI